MFALGVTGRLFNSAALLFRAVVISSRILRSDIWLRIAYEVFFFYRITEFSGQRDGTYIVKFLLASSLTVIIQVVQLLGVVLLLVSSK